MDSGNSGSLHSSSTGGDDEYDSRAATYISNPPSLFGDPFSNLMALHQNENPFLVNPNTTILGSASLRSDPNPALGNVINPLNQAVGSGAAERGKNKEAVVRKPKKRTRASRRAPTTVLTTDAANFRAMVQEFTGVPSPPFDHLSLQRSRLDLAFPPPYLRRPLPRKPQSPPPFLTPSPTNTRIPSILSTIGIPNSIDPTNYQFISNLSTIPNPNPILQTNPKFAPQNSSPIPESNPNTFNIDRSLDDLLNTGNRGNSSISSLQTLISSSNQIPILQTSINEEEDFEARTRPFNGGYMSYG